LLKLQLKLPYLKANHPM